MNSRNNILITSAGQRVSLVKFFKEELKAVLPNAKIIAVDANPKLAPACYIADFYEQIPKVSSPNYIKVLLEVCDKWLIKVIVPTIDTELLILSENKTLFEDKGISIVVSDESFIIKCRDKRKTNLFFEENSIEIPNQMDKNSLTYPLFIKPYDGSLSKDIFLIKSENELTLEMKNNPKFMFMEYINSDEFDEYTVDAYYGKDNLVKCVIPRKRIFVRAGEVNKGVTIHNELVDLVKDKLNYIEGAIGCLTIQFFFNSKTKRIVGIEINPRFGGGYPLSYLAGGNFPKWIIKEYFFEESIEYMESWKSNLLMLRYDAEVLVENYED
jgi:carbamoyl-phosphate synthase large subunit